MGIRVILVGQGSPEESERFRMEFAPDLPVISDPDRELFRAYGLGRGSLAQMASPGVLFRGFSAMSRGNMPGIPKGDVLQLAGVFLVDTEGLIRYAYFAKDASDYPSVENLLGLEKVIVKKRDSTSEL